MAASSFSVVAGVATTTKLHTVIRYESVAFPISTHNYCSGSRPVIRASTQPIRATDQLPMSPYTSTTADDQIPDLRLPKEKLSDCWRKIHGKHDWAGLLDPMSPILRAELIRYGEMAQACYEAFDNDPRSVNCGGCKYREEELFSAGALDMERCGYTVTRYLYATSTINILPSFFKKPLFEEKVGTWSRRHANWIGYVAVSNDETSARLGRRDITVAWRGTVTGVEWIHDLLDILRPISSRHVPCWDPKVKVESGFVRLYAAKQRGCQYSGQSPRDQVLDEIRRLVGQYGDHVDNGLEGVSITVTGHSLGSALAVLSAFDVAETGSHLTRMGRHVPVSVFSFSGPRVGNRRFKERLEELQVMVLRAHNVRDVVPTAPGLFINENWPWLLSFADGLFPWCYTHVGSELALDHQKSTFLKGRIQRAAAHDLELLLHLIDGWHGTGEQFTLATPRDIALLNKGGDVVKDALKIPPFWRQDAGNKGMAKDKHGHWVPPHRDRHADDHLPHNPIN